MDPRPAHADVIGRDSELAVADRFLDAAGAGFAVLRIGGVAGIGKSTLWSEVARRARERGCLVLASRPSESEARISLAAVADLLEAVPDSVVAALPGPQRRAIEVTLVRAEPAGTTMPERSPGDGVPLLAGRARRERPVVVAIDDVQWLDTSSADMLAFVARRLDRERVGLLVAHRAGTRDPLRTDRLDPPSGASLDLGPLTVGARSAARSGNRGLHLRARGLPPSPALAVLPLDPAL